MKSIQNTKLMSIRLVIAFTLTVLGSAQVTLGGFPEFTSTAGVPEGVAVDIAGNIYVSVKVDSNDQVWKYSPSGVGTLLSDLGESVGSVAGLALDNSGNVYMCRALVNPGVYQITPYGQTVMLPGTEEIAAANALTFDTKETLYVSETFSGDLATANFGQGGIWCIPKNGIAQLWLRDELLTGLPPALFPYPVGANGIGFYNGDLYVANSDKGLVIRIPILQDGSPGLAEIWKTVEDVPESPFYQSPAFPVMLDGLTIDSNGNVYVAIVSRNAIVRINANDRSQETVAVHPDCPLDAPASLALNASEETLFITNLGMWANFVPNPEQPWTGPGLVCTALFNEIDPRGIWTGRMPRVTTGEEQLAHTQMIGEEKNGISSIVMTVLNPDPTYFGMFPDATTRSDSLGTFFRTGPNTWNYTLISYGTRANATGYDDIIWIQIDKGTATATDSDTIIATGRVELYSGRDYPNHPVFGTIHDQDTDPRDGFPDTDEEPIFSTDYEVPQYRMPMLL